MNPSSSSGSQHSLIRISTSSLSSFSPETQLLVKEYYQASRHDNLLTEEGTMGFAGFNDAKEII